ncbi:hypothetical protein [Saccharopolyspora mangrovi]|uniref:DUF4229 domain-containing protein n=1 Tax=Saccharopolyspora mangrovi TaxID=3082379 RepID=A0ABU6A3N9_9PSEU|nr:hypothetical protein [Saccharopolyspora sp. S2-29]MEB3366189.1 hypothetical protein [Saccharopolyspora sp. S2-29]
MRGVVGGTLIVMVARVALAVAGVAAVAAVVVAIVLRGWEFASWVATVISLVALAVGWLTRAKTRKGGPVGDTIKQSGIRAGRDAIAKRVSAEDSQDEITQDDITAERDVIGKDTNPSGDN